MTTAAGMNLLSPQLAPVLQSGPGLRPPPSGRRRGVGEIQAPSDGRRHRRLDAAAPAARTPRPPPTRPDATTHARHPGHNFHRRHSREPPRSFRHTPLLRLRARCPAIAMPPAAGNWGGRAQLVFNFMVSVHRWRIGRGRQRSCNRKHGPKKEQVRKMEAQQMCRAAKATSMNVWPRKYNPHKCKALQTTPTNALHHKSES